MKKLFIILAVIFLLLLAGAGGAWYGLNHYVIPQIIIPEVKKQIAEFNLVNKANLSVQEIYFTIPRGFQLKEIEWPPLFSANEVDIDLDYLALLSRQVHITKINIIKPQLTITRSPRGEWNFTPAIKSFFAQRKQNKQNQQPPVIIDQISFSGGQIKFNDYLQKSNRLSRHFQAVAINVKNVNGSAYEIEGQGEDVKRHDAAQFKLNYDEKTALLRGTVKLKVANLASYRDYYLDDLMAPWQLERMALDAQADVSYQKGDFSLQGVYSFKNGKISYGDTKLAGNGKIKHCQKYVRGKPQRSFSSAEVEFNSFSLHFDKESVLEKSAGLAVISGTEVLIKKLKGVSQDKPVDLKGEFGLAWPRHLNLTGQIGQSENVFHLKMVSNNMAMVDWLSSVEASYLKAKVNISDLKQLLFSGTVAGRVDLAKLTERLKLRSRGRTLTLSMEAATGKLSGRLGFIGKLEGKLNKPESLTGKLGLKFDDFSILGLEPLSFLLGMKVEKGVFSSGIPPMHLYQGDLTGAIVLDAKHWGIELHITKADLARFAKIDPRFVGLAGVLSGQIACVGPWNGTEQIHGGGAFSLTDADLKTAPIFNCAQQGVGSVVNNFQMPDFKEVKGDFDIADSKVNFVNTLAKAPDIELRGSGTIDYSGRADFTMGVKFLQQQDWKTPSLIIYPLRALSFDLLNRVVKVEIKGVFPDLQQTTSVQPLAWLTNTYGQHTDFAPDKYSLEKLW